MQRRHSVLGSALSASLVTGLALITIFGLLSEDDSVPATLTDGLLQLVAVVAAFAVLIGVLNLIGSVHLRRLLQFRPGWFYSWVTILSAIGVVAVYFMDENEFWSGDLEGEQLSPRLFQVVQVTIESALAGLLLFFLVYAAYRMLRSRVTLSNVLFLAVVLIVLLGSMQMDALTDLRDFKDWITQVPAESGARGLLIGIGLGTVAVGIRVLLAQEHMYRQPPQN